MNNNIQESYCSYKVAQLLKAKGFNIPLKVTYSWTPHKKQHVFSNTWTHELTNSKHFSDDNSCVAPTHALAIEWLRVNFNIHIYTIKKVGTYKPQIYSEDYSPRATTNWDYHETPSEATEAALMYTLTHLI